MTKEDKVKKFREALKGVLFFAMNECIQTDWMKDADIDVGYIVSDYFEDMADTVIDIKTIAEFYDTLLLYDNSALNYMLTQDINNFDISDLSKEELEVLQKKVYHELATKQATQKPLNQALIDNGTTSIGRFDIKMTYDEWSKDSLGESDYITGDITEVTQDYVSETKRISGYTDNGQEIEIDIFTNKEIL